MMDVSRSTRLVLLLVMAGLGWFALGVEGTISIRDSLASGYGLVFALFRFLRFFTILTNIGIAALMSVTAYRLARDREPPAASLYAAALVYALVVCLTYEVMLRALWSPRGVQFYSDMIMHDVVPALLTLVWITVAPKAPLGALDPLRWLVVPATYFGATLIAGALGAGYPYGFLDAARLGYPAVIRNALIFLAMFYGLGAAVVAVAGVVSGAGANPGWRAQS